MILLILLFPMIYKGTMKEIKYNTQRYKKGKNVYGKSFHK